VEEIIKGLTEPQKRGLLQLHEWCKHLSIGGSDRTGKTLQKKGLAASSGEFYGLVDHIRITDLGIKVAEELIRIEEERMTKLRAVWAANDKNISR
jgi:hypothetical protein